MIKLKIILTILSLVTSTFSFILSIKSFAVSSGQFEERNQGYLQPDVTVKIAQYGTFPITETPDENTAFGGLSFFLTLKDRGNIPVEFEIRQMDVFLDGLKLGELDVDQNTSGKVYPNQDYTFRLPSVYVQKDNSLTLQKLWGKVFKVSIEVKYNDIESSRSKMIKRDIEFEVHQRQFLYFITNIQDRI